MVAILAPDPVQQGQQTVMKEVEKEAELLLPLGVLPRQRVEVVAGHRRLAAMQAEKRDLKLVAAPLIATKLQHIAGWKAEGGCRLETDLLVTRQVVETTLLIRPLQPVEQLDQLEEVEARRLPCAGHIREC